MTIFHYGFSFGRNKKLSGYCEVSIKEFDLFRSTIDNLVNKQGEVKMHSDPRST